MLQFRRVHRHHRELVLLYLLDLKSANRTCINGETIEAQRYYEVRHKDVITFAHSEREYVIIDAAKAEEEL